MLGAFVAFRYSSNALMCTCVLVVTVFAVYICHYVFHDHGSLFLFVDASRNYFAYLFGEW